MHKRPSDLGRYVEVIKRVKPAVIVETGLYYGGSQLWFADQVPHHIAVELPDTTRDANNQTTADYRANRWGLGLPPENGHIVEGFSYDVYDEVADLAHELADGGPIMVVLDSDHSTETVYREAVLYHQLVTVGSYLVIEDGLLHYLPQEGATSYQGPNTPNNWFNGCPLCATQRFRAENYDFELDAEIEGMFPTTQHPGGWLKRIGVNVIPTSYGPGDDLA